MNGVTSIDTESVLASLKKINFSVKDNKGKYQEEWLTTNFINMVFKNIEEARSNFEDKIVNVAINYANNVESISESAIKNIPEIYSYGTVSGGTGIDSTINQTTNTTTNNQGTTNNQTFALTQEQILNLLNDFKKSKKEAEKQKISKILENYLKNLEKNNNQETTTNKNIQSIINSIKNSSNYTDEQKIKLEQMLNEYMETNKDPKNIGEFIKTFSEYLNNINKTNNTNINKEEFKSKIIGGSVNFRSGPTMKSRIKRTVHRGDRIKILEKTNKYWYKVQLTNGKVGFVSTKYIR